VASASDAVAIAAELLRESRWLPEPAPCAFHTGPPGATPWRCGGAWAAHFPQAERPQSDE
jgi:hypothetical protein